MVKGALAVSIRPRASSRFPPKGDHTMRLLQLSKATLAAAAACFALSGCLVTAAPPARPIAYADATVYGDGYVVRFDSAGFPYYHAGGTVRYVPRSHPRYNDYVRHRRRYHYRY
jgi:hypothetical protein